MASKLTPPMLRALRFCKEQQEAKHRGGLTKLFVSRGRTRLESVYALERRGLVTLPKQSFAVFVTDAGLDALIDADALLAEVPA